MTPLFTTLQFNVRKEVQDGDHNLFTYEPIFSKSVCQRSFRELCTIFGTTIFLDRRENAPIGENGF